MMIEIDTKKIMSFTSDINGHFHRLKSGKHDEVVKEIPETADNILLEGLEHISQLYYLKNFFNDCCKKDEKNELEIAMDYLDTKANSLRNAIVERIEMWKIEGVQMNPALLHKLGL